MRRLILKDTYEKLVEKLTHLQYVERPNATKLMEETRPIGLSEDNFEFLQALHEATQVDKKITELRVAINECQIVSEENIKTDSVGFGTVVTFKDINTNKEKKYKLLSIYDSDIVNNIISVESPLAIEMDGLIVGDYFSFNDRDYVITNIEK